MPHLVARWKQREKPRMYPARQARSALLRGLWSRRHPARRQCVMTHRETAIRNHTAAIQQATQTYRRENHCPCGEFIPFAPTHRDTRTCGRCKRAAA